MIRLGIDNLMAGKPPWPPGTRIGLLCNHASVAGDLRHSSQLIAHMAGEDLRCLFSPQHGFFAEKQDNMIESGHSRDVLTGIPIYSLYGDARRPSKSMFDQIDVLIVDLPDVGTRVYTFLYTMAYCLEAAARWKKKVMVLDRPNPISGVAIEGNVLSMNCSSFVGLFPIPMRHGLTFGELASYINEEFAIGADLSVVRMTGWHREMFFDETGLHWVFPSPNMPTLATAMVYPGQVLWEGTTVSEGRGTTLPFELCGAPYWQPGAIIGELAGTPLPGCFLRPLSFEPTSGKWSQQTCCGFQLHITDRRKFLPYRTSLALLRAVLRLYPDRFSYKEPPYEYDYERRPLDLILGDAAIREQIEAGVPIRDIERGWQDGLLEFADTRQKYFLY